MKAQPVSHLPSTRGCGVSCVGDLVLFGNPQFFGSVLYHFPIPPPVCKPGEDRWPAGLTIILSPTPVPGGQGAQRPSHGLTRTERSLRARHPSKGSAKMRAVLDMGLPEAVLSLTLSPPWPASLPCPAAWCFHHTREHLLPPGAWKPGKMPPFSHLASQVWRYPSGRCKREPSEALGGGGRGVRRRNEKGFWEDGLGHSILPSSPGT